MAKGQDFGWALAMMKEGRKARQKSWSSNAYYVLHGPTQRLRIPCGGGMVDPGEPTIDELLATDWEEYVEPKRYMSFGEAMSLVIGTRKSVTREGLGFNVTASGKSLHIDERGLMRCSGTFDYGTLSMDYTYYPKGADILATDWHEVAE